MKHRLEHRLLIASVAVSEAVLIKIGLQMLLTHGMVNTGNPALDEAPEALNRVGVDISPNVDLGLMLNALVLVAALTKPRKLAAFVGVDQSARHDVLPNQATVDLGANRVNVGGLDSALALDRSKDSSLVADVAASLTAPTAPDVGMVDFYRPTELSVILIEQGANSVEHPPCRLVGDTDFALKLLGRDATASRSHEKDRVKPSAKRCPRVLKDGACHRVLMVPTAVAGVGRAALNPVVLGDFATDLAEDAIGVQVAPEPIKTGCIIGEVSLEVADCIFLHGYHLPSRDNIA